MLRVRLIRRLDRYVQGTHSNLITEDAVCLYIADSQDLKVLILVVNLKGALTRANRKKSKRSKNNDTITKGRKLHPRKTKQNKTKQTTAKHREEEEEGY